MRVQHSSSDALNAITLLGSIPRWIKPFVNRRGNCLLILQLQPHHVDSLKEETNRVQPVEACGMLFGSLSKNKAVVTRIVFTVNKLKSSVKFEIDPVDAVVAFADAEKTGLEFIGLFHSHPAPAEPSSLDLKGMKLWGDALWLIYSSVDGSLAAYQLVDGDLEQVTISIG